MKRCSFVKKDSQQCKAAVLPGEELCLFHSNSDKANDARQRARDGTKRKSVYELSDKDMIRTLKHQYKKVKRDATIKNEMERARVLLNLIETIKALEAGVEYEGAVVSASKAEPEKKPEEKEKKKTFDEVVKEEEEKLEHS